MADQINADVAKPRSVAELLAGLSTIDPEPYDFPAPPLVPDAKCLGTLRIQARRLHAARMMAEHYVAEAEQALAAALDCRDAVRTLFELMVAGDFPAPISVELDEFGVAHSTVDIGHFFGPGWRVYTAPTSVLEALASQEMSVEEAATPPTE